MTDREKKNKMIERTIKMCYSEMSSRNIITHRLRILIFDSESQLVILNIESKASDVGMDFDGSI